MEENIEMEVTPIEEPAVETEPTAEKPKKARKTKDVKDYRKEIKESQNEVEVLKTKLAATMNLLEATQAKLAREQKLNNILQRKYTQITNYIQTATNTFYQGIIFAVGSAPKVEYVKLDENTKEED